MKFLEKDGLVIYKVENDKVKLVLGLGTSDKWDHIATVELSVQATGCLLHHWIARAILEPKSGSMMFLSVLFDQVPPWHMKFWKFWKLGFFFLWYYCICSIFSIYLCFYLYFSISILLSLYFSLWGSNLFTCEFVFSIMLVSKKWWSNLWKKVD